MRTLDLWFNCQRKTNLSYPSPRPCGERVGVRGLFSVTNFSHANSHSVLSDRTGIELRWLQLRRDQEEPLTLTLSPQGRGEGTSRA